jgi:hypothetical protein
MGFKWQAKKIPRCDSEVCETLRVTNNPRELALQRVSIWQRQGWERETAVQLALMSLNKLPTIMKTRITTKSLGIAVNSLLLGTLPVTLEAASAPTVELEERLVSNTPSTDGYFGSALTLNGNMLAVGAFLTDKVYTYTSSPSGWVPGPILTPVVKGTYFGQALDSSPQHLAVGSMLSDDFGQNTGSVYVYDLTGRSPVLKQQLFADATGHALSAEFGRSVSIDGNRMVVGNPRDDDKGAASGSAYVFNFDGTTWNQGAKLLGSTSASGDEFGSSVAIQGLTLAVGAEVENTKGVNAGAVYVSNFDGANWVESQILFGSGISAGSAFGTSMDMDGDYLAVGAPGQDSSGLHPGAVYVFKKTAGVWTEQAKLTAEDFPAGAFGMISPDFGITVALDGGTLLVGSRFEDAGAQDTGAAYLYKRNGDTWTLTERFLAKERDGDDWLGTAVAVHDDDLAIGANHVTVNGFQTAGAVYLVTPVPEASTIYSAAAFATMLSLVALQRRHRSKC